MKNRISLGEMYKNILIVLSLVIFYSCMERNQKDRQAKCDPYFYFDELQHYTSGETIKDSLDKLLTTMPKTLRDTMLNIVLLGYKPETLKDTVVLKDLEALGFTRKTVASTKFQEVDEIFCEKHLAEITTTNCVPVYNDILIFKLKHQIVGIAKVCFKCGQHIITGTNKNTFAFGQSGDYQKLMELLD